MTDKWKQRCDNYHLGHFVVDNLRKGGDEICQIDAASGAEETCASVLSRSIRLAQCFKKLGMVPGDVVVLAGKTHMDLHIPFYAAMMSGLPVAGVDPALKCSELKSHFSLSKPKIIFCEHTASDEFRTAVQELDLDTRIFTFGGGQNSFEKLMNTFQDLQHEDEFKIATFNTDEVYGWLVSTSGSTRKPKVVALTHCHILQMYDPFFSFKESKHSERKPILTLSSMNWISGCFNALLIPINHIKLQTSAPATPEHIIDIINTYKPVSILCTPTTLPPILHHEKHCDLTCFDIIKLGGNKIHKEFLVSLRPTGHSGGPKFQLPSVEFSDILDSIGTLGPWKLLDFVREDARLRADAIIHQGYGLSEIGGVITDTYSEQPYGTVGKLKPVFEAKIVSPETGKEILEPNVPGELYVRGPVMAGYYNDPEETASVFTEDGYFKTGDLLYKDECGFYFFVERLKMLLKYKDYSVVPPEVEAVILLHEGVLDVCVTGIPHVDDGEHVVACVVRRPGHQVTAQDIKDLVAKHLSASTHLHGGVVFLDSLPTTASGKVARLQVRKLALTAHRE